MRPEIVRALRKAARLEAKGARWWYRQFYKLPETDPRWLALDDLTVAREHFTWVEWTLAQQRGPQGESEDFEASEEFFQEALGRAQRGESLDHILGLDRLDHNPFDRQIAAAQQQRRQSTEERIAQANAVPAPDRAALERQHATAMAALEPRFRPAGVPNYTPPPDDLEDVFRLPGAAEFAARLAGPPD